MRGEKKIFDEGLPLRQTKGILGGERGGTLGKDREGRAQKNVQKKGLHPQGLLTRASHGYLGQKKRGVKKKKKKIGKIVSYQKGSLLNNSLRRIRRRSQKGKNPGGSGFLGGCCLSTGE